MSQLHPYYWSTGLILNAEDAATATITDISPTPKTPSSVNGTAGNSAAQYKSGAKSLILPAASWIDYASHADFDFGSGAFTVAFWYRPAIVNANVQMVGLNIDAASTNSDVAWYVRTTTTGLITCGLYVAAAANAITSTTALSAGTWYHIEFSRDSSNVCRIRLNGVSDATPITYAGAIQTPASRLLRIGKYSVANNFYTNGGHIDGLTITKGYADHSADYTTSFELYAASPAGTMAADLTGPMGTLASLGGAAPAMTGPMGTLQVLGSARAAMTGPMGTLIAVGHDASGEREFIGTAPMGTLSVLGGATAQMSAPMGTLVASMTVPVSITAELVGPMGTLVASGTADVMMIADLRMSSAGSLVAHFGAQAMLTAPMGTLSAGATVSALMSFEGTAPMATLSAIMTSGIVMSAQLTAPMLVATPSMRVSLAAPMGTLIAIGTATVTIVYEAYAMNLKPSNKAGIHEVTRWDSMPFDGIVRHGNDYYGWGPGGLFLIGGTTDNTAAIAWDWKTAITDFGTSQKKLLREMVFAGRIGPTAVASVSIGERADTTYSYSTPRGQLAQNYRVKTGKGLKDAYYSVGLSGSDVGDVDSVTFGTAETTRRI